VWAKGPQKAVRWFLDADDIQHSHQSLIITFGPFTIFVEFCMQIHSVEFALSRQINKQKVCENNLLCTGNKVFVKYQAQEDG